MSSDGEWGPWIEHDGSGCPVEIGDYIQVTCTFNGKTASNENWVDEACVSMPFWYDALNWRCQYRVRRPPSAQMERLREIAANPPKMPVTEDA